MNKNTIHFASSVLAACVVLIALAFITFVLPSNDDDVLPPPVQETVPSPPAVSPVPEEPFYSERELECLALNSYFEARNQSLAGQIAVAQVVLNRVKSEHYPNTICEVIQQGPTYENWKGNVLPVRNQCHFSWWCDGMSDIPQDKETYSNILSIMQDLLDNKTLDITEGSVYYHADYVKPSWANEVQQTLTIDNHIFYKR